MEPKDLVIWQYENIKDLYLGSFQRLVTITTLINSGGILLNVTVLSEESKIFGSALSFCNHSFYPLEWSLVSFIIALTLNFYIIFTEFKYCSNEFTKFSIGLQSNEIYSPDFLTAENFNKYLWRWGYLSFFFMGLGIFLSLCRIVTLT